MRLSGTENRHKATQKSRAEVGFLAEAGIRRKLCEMFSYAELRTFAEGQRGTENAGYFPSEIPMRMSGL
jgi:hypothetical protein